MSVNADDVNDVDARKIEFEVPPMLSVSELESVVGKLTESQRKLAEREKDNAILRAKVEALERAEREGKLGRESERKAAVGLNGDKVRLRELEARNRELARLLGGSEAGVVEGVKMLRGVLENLEEPEK